MLLTAALASGSAAENDVTADTTPDTPDTLTAALASGATLENDVRADTPDTLPAAPDTPDTMSQSDQEPDAEPNAQRLSSCPPIVRNEKSSSMGPAKDQTHVQYG